MKVAAPGVGQAGYLQRSEHMVAMGDGQGRWGPCLCFSVSHFEKHHLSHHPYSKNTSRWVN